MWNFVTVPLFAQLLLSLMRSSVECKVALINNGYEGVTIVITDAIQEDNVLIQRIKEEFTAASALLFKATKNRAFFRNITIVVPRSWNMTEQYDRVPAVNAFTEHIRVQRMNKAKRDAPFVRGNLECGKPGWFMHVTPDFLKMVGTTPYGNHENLLVHQWAHLRWGVFDEYASIKHQRAGDPNHLVNFYTSDGSWKPVTCSKSVQGLAYRIEGDTVIQCNLKALQLPVDCKFCPNVNQSSIKASLMARQWISTMDSFCEEDIDSTPDNVRHNSQAPNLHNKMCNGRSVWEVLHQHEDFNGTNLPAPYSLDTTPTYRVVQETGRVRVFVFDVSGSMKGDKIKQQEKAAKLSIDILIEIGSRLGIVTFSSSATIEAEVTEIDNDNTKENLKTKVPTTAAGGTNILSGLQLAIVLFERNGFSTHGAEIILLSDGESDPYIDIIPIMKAKGILVHTIAISDDADADMALLAAETGGRSFTYLETEAISFADVLGQAVSGGTSGTSSAEKVFTKTYNISTLSPVMDTFTIEDGLGRKSSLTVVLPTSQSLVIEVTGPNNASYSLSGTNDILTIHLPETIQTGEYKVTIRCQILCLTTSATVSITSEPLSATSEVIRVTSRFSGTVIDFNSTNEVKVFASVDKGDNPVLNASCKAILAGSSNFTLVDITLEDSGIGADGIANDGIYTAYLVKGYFTQNGRYNLKILITGNDYTYTSEAATVTVESPENEEDICSAIQDISYTQRYIDTFQRESLPGEIIVVNYVANSGDIDITPPAQITDLSIDDIFINKAATVGRQSIKFTISWTAVGDDLTIGTANEYDLRKDAVIKNLRTQFKDSEKINVSFDTPKPSGTLETMQLTFTTDDCNGTCFIGVIAIDSSGNKGQVSNIVNMDVNFNYETESNTNIIEEKSKATDSSLSLGIILGIVAGIIVVVSIVFIAIARTCFVETCKNQQPVPKEFSEFVSESAQSPYNADGNIDSSQVAQSFENQAYHVEHEGTNGDGDNTNLYDNNDKLYDNNVEPPQSCTTTSFANADNQPDTFNSPAHPYHHDYANVQNVHIIV